MGDSHRYHFKLIDIGRGKFCGNAMAGSYDELVRVVSKHLMSRGIDITSDGTVLVGGFRPVGRVEPQTDDGRVALVEWCE